MTPATTALLSLARTCDHPDCGNEFNPTGDATTPFLSGPLGGLYFCSYECREAYPQEVSLLDHLIAAFTKAGMPEPTTAARVFLEQFGMRVDDDVPAQLDTDGETHNFRVISPPAASLIACVLCADQNFPNHVGTDGVTHTLMRIGDFSAPISRVHLAAVMREVRNVKLTKQVPLGASVLISVRRLKQRMLPDDNQFIEWQVSASLEATGELISKPTTVVTVGDRQD